MNYDNSMVAAKLRRWEKYLKNFRLPEWADIPDLGLYMEQVIELVCQYLDYMPPELKEQQFITPSTINNYVRMKVMPQPIKKRYYRIHIAYLIMILSLKQSLSISMIKNILPLDSDEHNVMQIYQSFAQRHTVATAYFVDQVKVAAAGILQHEDSDAGISTTETGDLIVLSAITSGFARLLAEKLLLLDGKDKE